MSNFATLDLFVIVFYLVGIVGFTEGQLYDLVKDPVEKQNQYEKYPDKVKELTTLLEEIKTKGADE